MLRTISIDQLRIGMYVVDLRRQWLKHAFWRTQFLIETQRDLDKLRESGLTEICIDTGQGDDVQEAVPVAPSPPPKLATPAIHSPATSTPEPAQRIISLGEERRRAGFLLREAEGVVRDLVGAACRGERVETGRLEPVISRMLESVQRQPDALVPLARLKQMGAYATEHAVSSTALVIALARKNDASDTAIEKIALGSLVKDIGQASLDARLIGKPGSLSQSERSRVHSHVEEGLAVLDTGGRLPDLSVAVVLEHHERFDGSGYPFKTSGEAISMAGRMAAIVDSYDAMTSDRPYRKALSPTAALRQMYADAGKLYDPALLATFIRTIGIYPVGTLVRLESGHLGIVEQSHPEHLLQPIVRVFFHGPRKAFMAPTTVDLSRKFGNHYGQIVSAESFEHWGLNPLSWQPA